uniref:Zinc finger protein 395b n=1 Tax=Xiphophorus couchianus TaxID=32473 RepID=A0A3B5LP46_9TELE
SAACRPEATLRTGEGATSGPGVAGVAMTTNAQRRLCVLLFSFRSPESVEMDEIMAAMVLTSLSCSPVVQNPPQTDPGPGQTAFCSVKFARFLLSFIFTMTCSYKKKFEVLSGSDQTQREEDFYYAKICCETIEAGSGSAAGPAQQTPGQASAALLTHRPSPLSQSAPSSFWQIHTEHLYQACSPVQVSMAPRSPCTVSAVVPPQMVKPRCRSVSVGEQWLQQNRLQPMSASPSRNHCSFRKGRGEAKKCRKVYGVERKDQWCTACRWKKACQRFPD